MKIIWVGGGVLLLPTLGGTEFSKDFGKHEEMAGVFCGVVCVVKKVVPSPGLFSADTSFALFFRILRVRPTFSQSIGLFLSSRPHRWFWWLTFLVWILQWRLDSWMDGHHAESI